MNKVSPASAFDKGGTLKELAHTSVSAAKASFNDFMTVLKDGLDLLDFGRLFDNDSKEGNPKDYVWRSALFSPATGDCI